MHTYTELNELLLKQNLRRELLTCQTFGTVETNRQTILYVQRDCENMRGHETKLVAVRIWK